MLDTAARLDVRVHRVSQGSGVFMLTDAELDDMARVAPRGARRGVAVRAPERRLGRLGDRARRRPARCSRRHPAGQEQVVQGLADIARAAEHGIRSVLIADLGLLAAFQRLRSSGALPADMQAKLSALFPVTNPATARVLVDLGANTLNISSDLTLPQIAAIRAAVDVPIDFYIEAPDGLGGFVRHHDVPEIIRIAAPVYLKFGVRGAPDIYPWGGHIAGVARALSQERVRRARAGAGAARAQRRGVRDVGARCRRPGAARRAIGRAGALS